MGSARPYFHCQMAYNTESSTIGLTVTPVQNSMMRVTLIKFILENAPYAGNLTNLDVLMGCDIVQLQVLADHVRETQNWLESVGGRHMPSDQKRIYVLRRRSNEQLCNWSGLESIPECESF